MEQSSSLLFFTFINHAIEVSTPYLLNAVAGLFASVGLHHILSALKSKPELSAKISKLFIVHAAVFISCFAALHLIIIPLLARLTAVPETVLEDERRFSFSMSHNFKRLVAFGTVAVLKSLLLQPVYQFSDRCAKLYFEAFSVPAVKPPTRTLVQKLTFATIDGTIRFIVTFSLVLMAVAVSWIPLIGKPLFVGVISWRMSFFFHSALWDLTPAGTSLHYKTMQIETRWAYHLGFGLLASTLVFALPTDFGDFLFGLAHPLMCLIAVSSQVSSTPIFSIEEGEQEVVPLPIFNLGNRAGDMVLRYIPGPIKAVWTD
ncbi:Etoposide-induced protein [Carpediemonas membranifera]|uniref:Etoposide-induced protein n=1 Tax=Carpediemonas membranifera TaxID=201153 RepID=A0A8J6DZ18_9EUKA|nr:Etoposide-induced protein [Carpediemonas membranifera]|eukprot:KAG9390128.1 Etoposide-induced protein [Carpediemonas membranifera]